MHLTLRLFVLCAAASAAADVAVPQSGASFSVVYPESGTSQAAAKEDGVYSLAGQFRPPKKGMLSGRKSVLSALGMLVGVSSAAVISFLLWKCFGRSRGEGSRVSPSRRLSEESFDDETSDDDSSSDVCELDDLGPEDLGNKAADMLKQASEKCKTDENKLEERKKKVDDARAARERLESALKHREDLPEESSAEAIGAADVAVGEARSALKTAVVELGGDLTKFSRLEAKFIRGVRVWLEKQDEETEAIEFFMGDQREKWERVAEALKKLEEALAALARVQPSGAEAESQELKAARQKVEHRAFKLKHRLYDAVAFANRQAYHTQVDYSYSYFATDDETDNDTDVEEVAIELPDMTVEELEEAAASSLAEAQARLEAEAQQLKERETALNLKEVDDAYDKLNDLKFNFETAENEQEKKDAREAFEKQRKVVEPLLLRLLGGKPIPEVDRLKVPGIFTNYVRSCFCTAEGNISAAHAHQERRQRTWERVRNEHERFRKLKERVADLQARDRTLQEEALLQSFRKRLEEARVELHELLKVAKKKDAIPLEEKQFREPISEEDYADLTEPIDAENVVGL